MLEKSALPDALANIGSGLSDAGSRLSDWYGELNPEIKKTLARGLVGAGVAGGGMGVLRSLTPRDPEQSRTSHTLSPAILAALLGGTAAAGLPYGLNMIGGPNSALRQHTDTGVGGALANAAAWPVMAQPGAIAGGGLGLAAVLRGDRKADAGTDPRAWSLRRKMQDLGTTARDHYPSADDDLVNEIGRRLKQDLKGGQRGPYAEGLVAAVQKYRQHRNIRQLIRDMRDLKGNPLVIKTVGEPKINLAKAHVGPSMTETLGDTSRPILERLKGLMPVARKGLERTGAKSVYNLKTLGRVFGGLNSWQKAMLLGVPAIGALGGKAIENVVKGE